MKIAKVFLRLIYLLLYLTGMIMGLLVLALFIILTFCLVIPIVITVVWSVKYMFTGCSTRFRLVDTVDHLYDIIQYYIEYFEDDKLGKFSESIESL